MLIIFIYFLKDNFGIYNKYFNNNGKIKTSLNNIDKYLPKNKKIIFLIIKSMIILRYIERIKFIINL